jgi:hypothetical protein
MTDICTLISYGAKKKRKVKADMLVTRREGSVGRRANRRKRYWIAFSFDLS